MSAEVVTFYSRPTASDRNNTALSAHRSLRREQAAGFTYLLAIRNQRKKKKRVLAPSAVLAFPHQSPPPLWRKGDTAERSGGLTCTFIIVCF